MTQESNTSQNQAEITPKVYTYKRFSEILPSPAASLYNLMRADISSNKVGVAITALRAWLAGGENSEAKRLQAKFPQGIEIQNVSTRHSTKDTVTVRFSDILKICDSVENVRNALAADYSLIMGVAASGSSSNEELEKELAS